MSGAKDILNTKARLLDDTVLSRDTAWSSQEVAAQIVIGTAAAVNPLTTSIVPSADNAVNLGSAALRMALLHAVNARLSALQDAGGTTKIALGTTGSIVTTGVLTPSVGSTFDIGVDSGGRYKDAFFSGAVTAAAVNVNQVKRGSGGATVMDLTTDGQITVVLPVLPDAAGTRNLGSTGAYFGSIYADQIFSRTRTGDWFSLLLVNNSGSLYSTASGSNINFPGAGTLTVTSQGATGSQFQDGSDTTTAKVVAVLRSNATAYAAKALVMFDFLNLSCNGVNDIGVIGVGSGTTIAGTTTTGDGTYVVGNNPRACSGHSVVSLPASTNTYITLMWRANVGTVYGGISAAGYKAVRLTVIAI
eukprot:c17453_g1_i2.p1 GENE.c17453_g1_i2~~c17453_g1_i2.p1  ORF type:complete len:360 (-),score=66.35 c17453_g1_i2:323-1402(-)